MLEWRFRRSEKVLAREIAGEQLLVPSTEKAGVTEYVYCLNPPATLIWKHLDGTHTVQQIMDKLLAEYEVEEVTAGEDLLAYLRELQKMGLIELVQEVGGDKDAV